MSASEKLKALEFLPRPGYGPGVPTYESGELRYAKAATVMAALPQIVAIVEAAEDFSAWPDHQSPDWAALATALSALEEALS